MLHTLGYNAAAAAAAAAHHTVNAASVAARQMWCTVHVNEVKGALLSAADIAHICR